MITANVSFCRKCLLQDMDMRAYQNIYDYISGLSPKIKADEILYRQRLDNCQTCDNLLNGLCRLCGCFVEARAAKKDIECPLTPPRW